MNRIVNFNNPVALNITKLIDKKGLKQKNSGRKS